MQPPKKEKKKRSKKILARKPHRTYHVTESFMAPEYAGGPKKRQERVLTVDDFTY